MNSGNTTFLVASLEELKETIIRLITVAGSNGLSSCRLNKQLYAP